MERIREITKQIWEELADAQKYIKCATKWGSDMYYDLSVEEISHAERLHSEGAEYVEKHKEEEPTLSVIWDWETDKILDMIHDVKVLQEMYKE